MLKTVFAFISSRQPLVNWIPFRFIIILIFFLFQFSFDFIISRGGDALYRRFVCGSFHWKTYWCHMKSWNYVSSWHKWPWCSVALMVLIDNYMRFLLLIFLVLQLQKKIYIFLVLSQNIPWVFVLLVFMFLSLIIHLRL